MAGNIVNYVRHFLVNDVQTPHPLPPIWRANFFFGTKSCAIFWNEWKINFPIFSFWDMVVQNSQNRFEFFFVQKVAQYSETNEKSIFWFLVFEIWSFKIFIIVCIFFRPKRCVIFWNGFSTKFENFAIFSFWDMVDFELKIRSDLGTRIQKKNYVRGDTFP